MQLVALRKEHFTFSTFESAYVEFLSGFWKLEIFIEDESPFIVYGLAPSFGFLLSHFTMDTLTSNVFSIDLTQYSGINRIGYDLVGTTTTRGSTRLAICFP